MSLKRQLALVIAAALTVTLCLGAAIVYIHALEKIDAEMSAAILVGTRIAHNAIDDEEEIANPRRRLELLVADFDGSRHLKAFVVDSGGTRVMTSRPASDPNQAPAWLFTLLAKSPMTKLVTLPPAFVTLGDFYLESEPRNEIAEVWDDLLIYLQLLLAYVVLSGGVMWFVVSRSLRPLQHLNEAFYQLGKDKYSIRMPNSGPMEVRVLALGFNGMAERLERALDQNEQLIDLLSQVQDEERAELSRNLHDEIGPLMFSVDVDATTIRRLCEEQAFPRIIERAASVQEAINKMKSAVRQLIVQLRPIHSEQDFNRVLSEQIEYWRSRHTGVSFEFDTAERLFDATIARSMRYVIGESVNNALKHGGPTRISIRIGRSTSATFVTISDDGTGRPQDAIAPEAGFGIIGMRERVANSGGQLEILCSEFGTGLLVKAYFPDFTPRQVHPTGEDK